ncbi:MAG: recombination protein NinB [Zoogloeaceae bacterium]|jgi:hypothetical protein|nr:recombination protein NinB [Zoogloeaceae bacterium]
MDRQIFHLVHETARRRASEALRCAPDGHTVTISPPGRNLEQNAAMWALLSEFSQQLEWPVNGRMETLTPEEWKDILTAGFRKETARVAMGLNGGVVMLGARTSRFSIREMSEFIEFLHATAIERGVDSTPEGESLEDEP